MNKTEFLNELEKRIRVLDKNEIKDILGEYSQHIDMRRESGLSEEDAIKDFGDMDELAAEILEAYHVNPEYDRELEKQEGIGKAAEALAEEITSTVKGPLKGFFHKTKELILKFFQWIRSLYEGFSKKRAERSAEKEAAKEAGREDANISAEEQDKNTAPHGKRLFSKKDKSGRPKKEKRAENDFRASAAGQLKKTKGRCIRLIGGIFTFCVSAAALLCLIPVTIAMLFSVFGFGISVIMMFTGYPLAGVSITLLGASLASVALWLMLATFIGHWYKNGMKARLEAEMAAEAAEDMAAGAVGVGRGKYAGAKRYGRRRRADDDAERAENREISGLEAVDDIDDMDDVDGMDDAGDFSDAEEAYSTVYDDTDRTHGIYGGTPEAGAAAEGEASEKAEAYDANGKNGKNSENGESHTSSDTVKVGERYIAREYVIEDEALNEADAGKEEKDR